MLSYQTDEQIVEDAREDDSFELKNHNRLMKQLRELRGKKLPVKAVYPEKGGSQ